MKKRLFLLLGLVFVLTACDVEPENQNIHRLVQVGDTTELMSAADKSDGMGYAQQRNSVSLSEAQRNSAGIQNYSGDDYSAKTPGSSNVSDGARSSAAPDAGALDAEDIGDLEDETGIRADTISDYLKITEYVGWGSPSLLLENCQSPVGECYPSHTWRMYASTGSTGKLKFKRTDFNGDEYWPLAVAKDHVQVKDLLSISQDQDDGVPELKLEICNNDDEHNFCDQPVLKWKMYASTEDVGRLKFKRYGYDDSGNETDEDLPLAIGKDKVEVNGTLFAEKIVVLQSVDLPDYVFDDNFDLMSLEDLDKFVTENHHLPGIPSEADVIEGGGTVSLGDSVTRLLQKVEELTLYTIEQNKQIKEQNKQIKGLQTKVNSLQQQITAGGN